MCKIVTGIVLTLFFPVLAQAGSGVGGDHLPPTPYLLDSYNEVVHSGSGLCWRTGYWTPALAQAAMVDGIPLGCACDVDVLSERICSGNKEMMDNIIVCTFPINLSTDTLFDFDRTVLKPEGKQDLDKIILRAKSINLEVILITGHTDRIGSDAYNQGLSERRADAVKEYLVSQGIDTNRVYVEGKGKTRPVTSDQCKHGMSRTALLECLQPDRRVEVKVIEAGG